MSKIVKSLKVYSGSVEGCKTNQRDVLIGFVFEGEERVHDFFLTAEQVEQLIFQLSSAMTHNFITAELGNYHR